MPLIKSSVTCIKLKMARRMYHMLAQWWPKVVLHALMTYQLLQLLGTDDMLMRVHTHTQSDSTHIPAQGPLPWLTFVLCVCVWLQVDGFLWGMWFQSSHLDPFVVLGTHLNTHMHAYVLTYTAGMTLHQLSGLSPSWWLRVRAKALCWWRSLTLSSVSDSLWCELIWGTLTIPRLHDTKICTTLLCSF